jgi:hypothetical protein
MWPPGATQSTVAELGNSSKMAARAIQMLLPDRRIEHADSNFMRGMIRQIDMNSNPHQLIRKSSSPASTRALRADRLPAISAPIEAIEFSGSAIGPDSIISEIRPYEIYFSVKTRKYW